MARTFSPLSLFERRVAQGRRDSHPLSKTVLGDPARRPDWPGVAMGQGVGDVGNAVSKVTTRQPAASRGNVVLQSLCSSKSCPSCLYNEGATSPCSIMYW